MCLEKIEVGVNRFIAYGTNCVSLQTNGYIEYRIIQWIKIVKCYGLRTQSKLIKQNTMIELDCTGLILDINILSS